MATAIVQNQKTTFTIERMPRSESKRKTLARLMRMQPAVKKSLRMLAQRRKREDNEQHQRGGRMWTARVKATMVVSPERGASFTLFVTPQILPDLHSVESCLKVSRAN